MKPPASRLTHLPPFLHTPGTHRPDDAFSSQCSPMRKKEGSALHKFWVSQVCLLVHSLIKFILLGLTPLAQVSTGDIFKPCVYCKTLLSVHMRCVLQLQCNAMWMINYLSSHHLINVLSSFYLFCEACCLPLIKIQTYQMCHLFGIQLF